MTTKALFIADFGALIPISKPKVEFTRTSGNILTATAHGLTTGGGPFKVMTTNADAPSGIVVAVHSSGTLTGAAVIATDVGIVAGKTYTVIAAPAADGDVDLGASDADTMVNMGRAINLGPAAGTDYDAATVGNPTVEAAVKGAILTITAKTLDASVGDAITISSPDGTITASGATLASGADGTDYFIIRLDANTFSVATTKANAVAGTAVALADAGTGVHQLVWTIETIAEALEDVLLNFLTATGARVLPAADNIANFWQAAIDGTAVHGS